MCQLNNVFRCLNHPKTEDTFMRMQVYRLQVEQFNSPKGDQLGGFAGSPTSTILVAYGFISLYLQIQRMRLCLNYRRVLFITRRKISTPTHFLGLRPRPFRPLITTNRDA